MNFYELIVVGGGAAGLMAAYASAQTARQAGDAARPFRVAILEKMPRPGRKLMLTGKGRCNLTNVKNWEDFQVHVHPNPRQLRPAFYQLPPEKLLQLMAVEGLETVVERGDRAFPASHRAVDVVDTLQKMVRNRGAQIFCGKEVSVIQRLPETLDAAESSGARFELQCSDGSRWQCNSLIITTGGLAYPMTGSSGDGLRWARELGLSLKPTFPSLTALVPTGYKTTDAGPVIERDTPLSELGQLFCGLSLKNVALTLYIDNTRVREETGDLDFTDGGLEGPLGFRFSRQCVHAMRNGSRIRVEIDLKPGVSEEKLARESKTLAELLPGDIARAFRATALNRNQAPVVPKGLTEKERLAFLLKHWTFQIAGYVGYERSVVTAGGVSTDEVSPKTLGVKSIPGLYLAGELLDLDADTGGYNLQIAFCTGFLAGQSAVQELINRY